MSAIELKEAPPPYSAANHAATWYKYYPLHGQGIMVFNILRKSPFEIVIRPEEQKSTSEWLSLAIHRNKAEFKLGGKQDKVLAQVKKDGVGYDPEEITSYWFSFNRDGLALKYGKGYFMEETTLLSFDFIANLTKDEEMKERDKMSYLFSPKVHKTVELYDIQPKNFLIDIYALSMIRRNQLLKSYTHMKSNDIAQLHGPSMSNEDKKLLKSQEGMRSQKEAGGIVSIEKKVDFYPHPLVSNWPFAVLDSSQVSLFELDQNNYIPSASLPAECLELYSNVSAVNVDLNWTPSYQKYKLSDAIRHSFKKGVLCEKVEKKKMKYLRVTLGPSRASSPGIPYVLELWPKNNGSPIHNHSSAYAVIRVLYGGLRVEVYNKDMKEKIKQVDVREGDVTWISPYWYQAHRLFNDTDDFCATIQCYKYGQRDKSMWPYFDYVDDHIIEEFLPDSDFTFTELYDRVLEEYKAFMKEKEKDANYVNV